MDASVDTLLTHSPADRQAPRLCSQILFNKYFKGLILNNINSNVLFFSKESLFL